MNLNDYIGTKNESIKSRLIEAFFPKYANYSKSNKNDYIVAVCIQLGYFIYNAFFILGLTYIFEVKTLIIVISFIYAVILFLTFNPKVLKKIIKLTKQK